MVLTKQLSLSKTAPRYPACFNAVKSIWRMSSCVDTVKNEREKLVEIYTFDNKARDD